MKINTTYLSITYLSIIILFGFIYSNIPNIFIEGSVSFGRALYFSTLTITTLSNAEINQTSNLAMALVAIESILGIIFIILFLRSTWESYISKIDKAQTRQIKRRLDTLDDRKLKMFSGYFILVVNEYRIAYKQFMMPLSKVSKNSKLSVDFKFTDLKYSLENATDRAVVEIFYEKQDICNENLKYLLSNSQVFRNPKLYSSIISFLHLSLVNDPRNVILSTDNTVKPTVQDQIITEDTKTTKPIKIFYKTLKMQYRYLKIIHHELNIMNR